MGRPKLLHKEGHHRHPGFDRWHGIDQSHGSKTALLHKAETHEEEHLQKNGVAGEIYSLVLELEKRELGHVLINELQKSIETILNGRKNPDPELSDARKPEQESLGKEGADEKREPNTYGLP